MGFNEPPESLHRVEAELEVFVPHGTLNLTTSLASAHDDVSGLDFTWVMNVSADRIKCWAERDDKTVVTVELLLTPLLTQMAEVAVDKAKEVEARA
jgi:hypothetical protein